MAKKKRKRQGLSVTVMVVLLMVAIAYLCWAIAASTYFGAVVEPTRRFRRSAGLQLILTAFVNFLANSVRLDAAPAVLTNSLRNHPWHVGLFLGLEAAAIGFGLFVKRLETTLNRPLRGLVDQVAPALRQKKADPGRPRKNVRRPKPRA